MTHELNIATPKPLFSLTPRFSSYRVYSSVGMVATVFRQPEPSLLMQLSIAGSTSGQLILHSISIEKKSRVQNDGMPSHMFYALFQTAHAQYKIQ